MIDELTKQHIFEAADLVQVISDFQTLHKSGTGYYTKCPKCGKDGKNQGLSINPAKSLFKCFHCENISGNNAVAYLLEAQGMSYPEALKYLAEKYHIDIEEPKPTKPANKSTSKKKHKSFCDLQLEDSGLTPQDVIAKVREDDDEKTIREVATFRSGSRDQYNQITSGDDMLIYYYDLEGKPVMYQKPNTNKFEHLYRVRWQVPELHRDKNEEPVKYQSPKGSGSHLYFPEIVREFYRNRRPIKRLYIQEGEKKAEKACKHGLISVGIMGIHNLGQNGKLPHEMQLLVQACGVREVVFILDSDWDQISENVKPGKRVDLRSWTFFHAVKNFKEYFKTLYSLEIYLEIYFAVVRENESKDKGIDDLLVKTLKDREDLLKADIEKAIHEKDGTGEFIQIHKITTQTDHKIMQFWELDSAEKFARRHQHILEHLPEFLIGDHKWRFREGRFESAQPLEADEVFWDEEIRETRSGFSTKSYHFDYENCYNFLRNRGYGRLMMADGQYQLAHMNGHVVEQCESYRIKDFVMQLTREIAPKDVRNMLYRGGKMYLGPDSLSNMEFIKPEFERADKTSQMLYFRNKAWKITAKGLDELNINEISQYIWKDKINDFDAKVLETPMVSIDQQDGHWDGHVSELGKKCHFLVFLINSSNFFWKKALEGQQMEPDEAEEMITNFIAKMTTFGYLIHSYKDRSQAKAVICMDGEMSEVGASNGRTGKSLFGLAVEQVVPLTYIAAKNKAITEDPFLFEEVTEKTEVVFLDDVRANLDFEFFFPLISGRLTINRKGDKKFTLSPEQTPKLLISTNHAIIGEGASFKDRQAFIAFSDYYNENHKPTDDFNQLFFDEWGYEQWNLFYNFSAECLQAYLKYGIVRPPEERLEKRRLRQQMGEVFLAWAEEYYSGVAKTGIDSVKDWIDTNIGKRVSRKELFDRYLDYIPPKEKRYATTTSFKKNMKAFCRYNAFTFNPKQGGKDDKSGGVEYFTVDKLSD